MAVMRVPFQTERLKSACVGRIIVAALSCCTNVEDEGAMLNFD